MLKIADLVKFLYLWKLSSMLANLHLYKNSLNYVNMIIEKFYKCNFDWCENWQKPIRKSDRSSFNVHMSSSEFQAVDLDAVLDEFESSQNLVEENTTMGKEDHKTENVIKPHLLENLNALPESPPMKTVRFFICSSKVILHRC